MSIKTFLNCVVFQLRLCRQWSDPDHLSVCKPIHCPTPVIIANGHFSGNTTYLSEVAYECDNGYELHVNESLEENAILVCQADRRWSHVQPNCRPVSCGSPPIVSSAKYVGDSFTYGSEVVYFCDTGYEMEVG